MRDKTCAFQQTPQFADQQQQAARRSPEVEQRWRNLQRKKKLKEGVAKLLAWPMKNWRSG